MSPLLRVYAACWGAATLLAAVLAVARRRDVDLLSRAYGRFLLRPWKVVAFVAATALVTVAGPWSGDVTWDLPDSLLISTLVFLLAPWAVGSLYRDAVSRRFGARTFVAAVAFWIPCWAYDAYILLRDGVYPETWAGNLGLSGGITLLGGLFWNLGRADGERSVFAFRWRRWPSEAGALRGAMLPATLLAIPVVVAIAAFVVTYLWP